MTLKEAAQLTLDIQNAVNMQAVLASWAKVQPVIAKAQFADSRVAHNIGGVARRHPINILFMSKLAAMMVVATDSIGGVYRGATIDTYEEDLFASAYDEVKRMASDAQATTNEIAKLLSEAVS